MEGEAQACVEAHKTIATYEELTTLLKKEYKKETNLLSVHKTLAGRKKKMEETYIEYMYKMMTLGKEQMDEESMIEYIVDGLPDNRSSKTTLYEASSYEDLKSKLLVFKPQTNEKSTHNKNGEKDSRKSGMKDKKSATNTSSEKKCFTCGKMGHMKRTCPDTANGRKCFNCEQYGHISKDCRVPKKSVDTSASTSVMCNVSGSTGEMILTIKIKNSLIEAMLDSGSPHTIMTKSTFRGIAGMGRWISCRTAMKGLSSKEVYTAGYVHVDVTMCGELYEKILCYIVDDYIMPMNMILGRNITNLATVTIVAGVPTTRKIVQQIPENNIMLIQCDENDKVEALSCIQDITDDSARNEVTKLVREYNPKKNLKSQIQMELLLVDDIPVYQNPRRLSAVEREAANTLVTQFLDEGIIRPSKSPYASPILLRKKKNGTYRFCVDYRKLNEKVVKDRYPLPLMEDVIEGLHDVAESSVKYTAFITPDGHYEFVKAPFGLCNSPAIFQRYINMVFHEARQEKLLHLYLDDVVIPAVDEAENLGKLRRVFQIAAENSLIINFEKCTFLQKKINFLGYILENGTIRPSTEKTKAIETFPQPRNVKAVQSFLGLTGFFRKFIPSYATTARPLTQLLSKGQDFNFGEKQIGAFEELKNKLCAEPVLKLYNPQAATQLHTDASALGYGGCLLQKQADDGLFHPIYYLSFKTTPAEAKLHSYELEVLAIIRCLEKLRCYVLRLPFEIYTDCQAFQQTMKKKTATAKVARWALALEEYDVKVLHRPGKSMQHVDALSRNFVMAITTVGTEADWVAVVDDGIISQVRNAQLADNECKMIRLMMEKATVPNYVDRDGVLYYFCEGYYRLKVPKAMAHTILMRLHGDDHISKRRMEVLAKQDYHITDLGKIIDKIVMNCVTCILATKKQGKQEGWLHPIEKFDVPLHTYHMDHVGPMESTNKNYKHILVVVDAFTKFTWLYPTKTTKCEEVIQKLTIQQKTFGNPARIVTDKGSAFIAEALDDYCKAEGINLHLITTATPRGNGQVERINGIIKPTITKMAIEEPAKWFKYVDKLQRCINSVVSRSTGNTPFQLMFGTRMRQTDALKLVEVLENEIINNFQVNRTKSREKAAQMIAKVQGENTKQFNKFRKQPHLYTLGDLVAIMRVHTEKGAKFRSKMIGPYEVTRVMRHDRYTVRKLGFGDGPVNTSTSADKMKPWADGVESSDDE